MSTLTPVILCGGSGTRLWPLSREQFPKQLLALVEKQSLLQSTVMRVVTSENKNVEIAPPLIITNEEQRFLVAEQLREVEIENPTIILEPKARNTAPALTLAALQLIERDPDALMLVMPADHVIQNQNALHDAVTRAVAQIHQDELITFGIIPTRAETGYGYICLGNELAEGVNQIERFVEKPDASTAQSYLDSGNYVWNSGMFLFKASTWLKAIAHFRKDILQVCQAAFAKKTVDLDFIRVDEKQFSRCPSESIDYAVMEHVTEKEEEHAFKGLVIALDAGWSDIGSWESLWDISEKDAQGNVMRGDTVIDDTSNCLVIAENRLVSVIGLNNVIVVETPDAIMVADKSSSQNVKNIVKRLAGSARQEVSFHRKVHRPWGSYESIDNGKRFQVKRIVVNPGARLSLQMHHHRAEHWIVVTGTAKVTRGDETFLLSENESTYIPLGIKHRLENPGTIPLEIIEVQSGSYLGEDDIVRFQDEYGRNQ